YLAYLPRIDKLYVDWLGFGARVELDPVLGLLFGYQRGAQVQQVRVRINRGESVARAHALAVVLVDGALEAHGGKGMARAAVVEADAQAPGKIERIGGQRPLDHHDVLGTGQLLKAVRNLELPHGNGAHVPAFVSQVDILVFAFSGEVVADLELPVVGELAFEAQRRPPREIVVAERFSVRISPGMVQVQAGSRRQLELAIFKGQRVGRCGMPSQRDNADGKQNRSRCLLDAARAVWIEFGRIMVEKHQD